MKETNFKAKSIWLTGLSGAGKTTIAAGISKNLRDKGITLVVLDGDVVRKGLCSDLQFTPEDRNENIRRIAEISRILIDQGISTINSFIQPTEQIRNQTRLIVETENYLEIFVNAPIEICESRDVKGLYKKARKGLIKDFTGISAPFETPQKPHLELLTNNFPIEECVDDACKMILKNMYKPKP